MSYHVNPKTGTALACKEPAVCPFGGPAAHYTTPEAALEAYELTLSAPLRGVINDPPADRVGQPMDPRTTRVGEKFLLEGRVFEAINIASEGAEVRIVVKELGPKAELGSTFYVDQAHELKPEDFILTTHAGADAALAKQAHTPPRPRAEIVRARETDRELRTLHHEALDLKLAYESCTSRPGAEDRRTYARQWADVEARLFTLTIKARRASLQQELRRDEAAVVAEKENVAAEEHKRQASLLSKFRGEPQGLQAAREALRTAELSLADSRARWAAAQDSR